MTNIRTAASELQRYITAHETAPSWGGPTMYPAPPSIADLKTILAAIPLDPSPVAAVGAPFQSRVRPWLYACFGEEISRDHSERNHRFLEEALELVQACGCTASEAHQLVDYTFGRPVGDPMQEVGGVMVTLAALCLANELDMHYSGEAELERIWTKVEAIRAKQAAKPKHSPLAAAPPSPAPVSGEVSLSACVSAEVIGRLDQLARMLEVAALARHEGWEATARRASDIRAALAALSALRPGVSA